VPQLIPKQVKQLFSAEIQLAKNTSQFSLVVKHTERQVGSS